MAGMYIYQALPDGIPVTGSHPDESIMHVVEVDEDSLQKGGPPGMIAIRVKNRDGVSSDGSIDKPGLETGPVVDDTTGSEVYWADKPHWPLQTYKEDLAEQRREFMTVWRMFLNDPLSPVRAYVHQFAMTGVGLFLEGYVIFSISNNSTLFKQSYKKCWSTFTTCNETWTQATTYLQLVGILIGQLFFGFLGDAVGRRNAMLLDMFIILAGLILLTASNGTTTNGWVICFAFAQFIFGCGIGGEYPMTSTRATEESEENRLYSQRHRGRKVMLSYTMQGWGQFINLSVLIVLLLIFNSSGKPPYSHAAAGATWRVAFGVLIPLVLYVIYYRIWVLKELSLLKKVKKRDGVTGYDWVGFRLLMTHFWHRLVGSAGVWFCNDWYFYGNGVFRSTFVGILIGPKASVLQNWFYSWINSGVQLVGYYGAALSVDYRWLGRKKLTTFSFLWVAALFAAVAGAYPKLILKHNIHIFQFLYYMSSFWALYGSHTTSFLLAAEMYPAQVRGTAHGISAATGKVGSIGIVVLLNYIDNRLKFWVTWPFALAGAIICWIFVADLTGMDLMEQERRWEYIRNGREQDYHGPAVHPHHLSLFERAILKKHRNYDPVADAKQKRQAALNKWTVRHEAQKATDGLLTADKPFEKSAGDKVDSKSSSQSPVQEV